MTPPHHHSNEIARERASPQPAGYLERYAGAPSADATTTDATSADASASASASASGAAASAVTPLMRAVVASWLSEVAQEFGLRQETLFLGVALLDRLLAAAAPAVRVLRRVLHFACCVLPAACCVLSAACCVLRCAASSAVCVCIRAAAPSPALSPNPPKSPPQTTTRHPQGVPRAALQLAGCAAMMAAAKALEVSPPPAEAFADIAAGAFEASTLHMRTHAHMMGGTRRGGGTLLGRDPALPHTRQNIKRATNRRNPKQLQTTNKTTNKQRGDLLRMERVLLDALGWRVHAAPTPYSLLALYLQLPGAAAASAAASAASTASSGSAAAAVANRIPPRAAAAAAYLLELALLDYACLAHAPSLAAAAALAAGAALADGAAAGASGGGGALEAALAVVGAAAGYSSRDLAPAALQMLHLMQCAPLAGAAALYQPLGFVREKFAHARWLRAAAGGARGAAAAAAAAAAALGVPAGDVARLEAAAAELALL